MPSLSLSIPLPDFTGMSTPVASSTPNQAAGNSADSFQALLDIGASNDDNTGDNEPPRRVERKNTTPDAPAAAIDAPAAFQQAPPRAAGNSSSSHNQTQAVRPDKPNDPAPVKDAPQDKAATPHPKSNAAASKPSANATSSQAKSDAGSRDDEPEENVSTKVNDQLQAIDQILGGVIQWLTASAGGAATTSPAATNVTDTGAAAAPATQSATNAPVSPIQTEINLLQDVQSAIHQFLAGQTGAQDASQVTAGGVNSDASGNAQADSSSLAVLNDAIAKLAQWLQQQQTLPVAGTGVSVALNVDPQADVKAALRNSIAQVRDALTQLGNETQQATVITTGFAQPDIALQQALLPKDPTTKKDDNAPDRGVGGAATIPANQVAPALPPMQPVNQPVVTQAIAAVQNAGADTDGDTSGGGQNQGQGQAPLASVSSAGPVSSSGSASGASFARALEQASPGTITNQVVVHLKTAIADGSSRIHIQLHPEDLGKLEIRLDVGADGKTGVTVVADNHHTLDLLRQDAQGLSRALADAGLATDGGSLNFNLRGGQQEQGQGGNAQAALTYQKAQPDDEDDMPISAITRSYVVNLADGLDIQI